MIGYIHNFVLQLRAILNPHVLENLTRAFQLEFAIDQTGCPLVQAPFDHQSIIIVQCMPCNLTSEEPILPDTRQLAFLKPGYD
jgi:hypothetical protein